MILFAASSPTWARAHPRRRIRPGLSLIEVMLSLAIFLMSLVAIARLVDMGTEFELQAQMQTRGARLAQSKMAEIVSGFQPLTPTSGTFDTTDPDWSFNVTAQLQGTNLYLVTVTVSRDVMGKQAQVSLVQMVYDPTMMGSSMPAERADTSTTSSTGTTGTGSTSSGSSGGTP